MRQQKARARMVTNVRALAGICRLKSVLEWMAAHSTVMVTAKPAPRYSGVWRWRCTSQALYRARPQKAASARAAGMPSSTANCR